MAVPGGWGVKNPPATAEDTGSTWEGPTWHRESKPACHEYWACSHRGRVPQPQKPNALEPCSAIRGATATRSLPAQLVSSTHSLKLESTPHSNEDPALPKIINKIYFKKLWITMLDPWSLYNIFTASNTSIGEGNGTPLQHSCLENPMDWGAWWAAVYGVTKSRTRLSDFTFTFHFHALE